MDKTDSLFAGSIPEVYDQFMVPLMFTDYAADMARRVAALHPGAVLETAAGSGVVTRALARLLPPGVRYVATDLNGAMLARAEVRQADGVAVTWQVADAQDLPFAAASFDVVCCQFGVMFFPDRIAAYAQALRVLTPGGQFLFNAWGPVGDNGFAATAEQAILAHYGAGGPQFISKVPHGYFDADRIRADLTAAGFQKVDIDAVSYDSRAARAEDVAMALCQGTPMRHEILSREPEGLAPVTAVVAAAVRARYGSGSVVAPMRALMVTAR